MKIAPVSGNLLVELAVGGVVLTIIVLALRQLKNNLPSPGGLGMAAGKAVGDTAAGVVVGLGSTVGVPATDDGQCSIDLANGDLWAASFSCPAPRYLAALKDHVFGSSAPSSGGASGSW